jgi:hypothetical protein
MAKKRKDKKAGDTAAAREQMKAIRAQLSQQAKWFCVFSGLLTNDTEIFATSLWLPGHLSKTALLVNNTPVCKCARSSTVRD